MAWNLKGAITWQDYRSMTLFDRAVLHRELEEQIDRHNALFND